MVRTLSLPRASVRGPATVASALDKGKEVQEEEEDWRTFESEFSSSPSDPHLRSLGHIFRKHLKPKKQHEVARMGQVVEVAARMASSSSSSSGGRGTNRVVDVGAGAGHLSRLLAHRKGFRVACIDDQVRGSCCCCCCPVRPHRCCCCSSCNGFFCCLCILR